MGGAALSLPVEKQIAWEEEEEEGARDSPATDSEGAAAAQVLSSCGSSGSSGALQKSPWLVGVWIAVPGGWCLGAPDQPFKSAGDKNHLGEAWPALRTAAISFHHQNSSGVRRSRAWFADGLSNVRRSFAACGAQRAANSNRS